jgi:hypothetical protein
MTEVRTTAMRILSLAGAVGGYFIGLAYLHVKAYESAAIAKSGH